MASFVQRFRFDVNPQFQVSPKLFPTDLEYRSTLAEMEVLQFHAFDQVIEIGRGRAGVRGQANRCEIRES